MCVTQMHVERKSSNSVSDTRKSLCVWHYLSAHVEAAALILMKRASGWRGLSSKNLLRVAAETICPGTASEHDIHFSLKFIQIQDKHIWQLDFAATVFALAREHLTSLCRLLMSLGVLSELCHAEMKANLNSLWARKLFKGSLRWA